MDATAQAANLGGETQGQDSQQSGEGVQRRIDELTRQKHEAERNAERHRATAEAAMAALAMRSQDVAAPQPEPVQVDPELRRQFEAMNGPFQRQLQAQLQQLHQAQALQAVRMGATKAGLPDPVRDAAEEIAAGYAAKGFAIEPEVAYDMAAGRIYRQQLASQANANQARNQFNNTPQVLGQQTMAGMGGQVAPQRPDLNAMSSEQRIQWYESNGIGDKPL